ncbi:hypothetical protein MIMGU_mgv1a018692mg [Erythranthe guttata]|uniref:Uncharacterized protein n=1 Tax=Erythranthe guttata TaxID=4155 RepID=A0A022PZ42_ERYGU|nr:hypothetical protein MIMGU_mgv1a018692mg [Erythranthe guttata]
MEGQIIRVLCFTVFLFLIIPKGLSQDPSCTSDKIHIEQRQTGNIVQSKPEWEVSIINTCNCDIIQLQLLCPNFGSVISTDQTLLSEIGNTGHCLFYGGRQLIRTDNYVINYVGDYISLAPYSYSMTTACSS